MSILDSTANEIIAQRMTESAALNYADTLIDYAEMDKRAFPEIPHLCESQLIDSLESLALVALDLEYAEIDDD